MNDRTTLERAIVLELLSAATGMERTCAQMAVELGAAANEVERAVQRLHEDGLVCLSGASVSASRAARRLDEMGLIGI